MQSTAPYGPHIQTLTDRQQEVVMLVARGASNRGIAQMLSISEKTVEKHLKYARQRLGAQSRTQLVALFFGGAIERTII